MNVANSLTKEINIKLIFPSIVIHILLVLDIIKTPHSLLLHHHNLLLLHHPHILLLLLHLHILLLLLNCQT